MVLGFFHEKENYHNESEGKENDSHRLGVCLLEYNGPRFLGKEIVSAVVIVAGAWSTIYDADHRVLDHKRDRHEIPAVLEISERLGLYVTWGVLLRCCPLIPLIDRVSDVELISLKKGKSPLPRPGIYRYACSLICAGFAGSPVELKVSSKQGNT